MKQHILVSLTAGFADARFGENLGIRYIKSFLNQNGYEVDILENQFERHDCKGLSERLSKYDVIGFSINYYGQLKVLEEVLEHIYKSEKIIYIGGHFASICYENLLKDLEKIDFVMLADGEEATLELVSRNFDYKSSHNVAFLSNEDVICNDIVLTNKLDALPFPYRDKNSYYLGDNHFSVVSSRGCYHNCTYCSVGSFTKKYFKHRLRLRSAENIFDELKFLREVYNVQYVTFQDDLFIGTDWATKKRAKELAELIIDNKLEVFFSIQCSVKSVDCEIFSLLKQAGLRNVMIGIENFSRHALECFDKKQDISDVKSAIDTLKQLGIPISFGFIMYYPEMEHSEIISNLEMLFKLNLINIRSITSLLQIYVGTDYCGRELNMVLLEKDGYSVQYHFKDPLLCGYIEKCKLFGKEYAFLERKLSRLEFLSHSNKNISLQKVNNLFSEFKTYLYNFCKSLYFQVFYNGNNDYVDEIKDRLAELEKKINDLIIELSIEI